MDFLKLAKMADIVDGIQRMTLPTKLLLDITTYCL